MAFTGFPPAALSFLADLRTHNDTAWFAANRATYEEALLEPAREFVADMGMAFHAAGIDVNAVPKVNGSLMRINRDTRFSRDKRPYKDHLDIFFWRGAGHSRKSPGFFWRLTPDELALGGGRHHFEPELLAGYRAAVAGDATGSELAHAVTALRAAGYGIGNERYKRVPAPHPADHPRADLLKHDGLFAWQAAPPPPELFTERLVEHCLAKFAPVEPLVAWLTRLAPT